MNPLLPGHSRTTPEPTRNALNTIQGTNEDDSQNDPHPEADLTQGHDMVTGAQRERERVCGQNTMTGTTKQNRNYHDMTSSRRSHLLLP